jgi:hypothetical protein
MAFAASPCVRRPYAVLDVNRDNPGDFYQPTTSVPVERVDGRWYLAMPLLANA